MHLMYFTEQPMAAYDAKEGLKYGATALTFSNSHYDPVAGSRLYNEYLEEYIMADEWGVDGIMLNEHHNAPFCMQARTNMFGAILAAVTKRAKIVFLGNPLPLSENPVQLAEEIAMIDMVSKGRVVSGFVRGGGQEQLANGVNPAYNRERFIEAHDLIQKTWTTAGSVPLGRHALPASRGEPLGGADAEAVSTRVDTGRAVARDGDLDRAAALSVHRAEHRDRCDQDDLGHLFEGGGGCRLHRRAGELRLPDPRARAGHRREGAAERAPVHVDAGRVHRARASGVGQPVGLLLAVRPPRLRRVRGGAREEPARPADVRGAGRTTR